MAVVVRRATGRPWETAGLALLLLGIVAAYSLDRVFDRPAHQPRWMTRLLLATAAAATFAGGFVLPHLPPQSAMLVPLAGSLALLYPLVKRVPLGKTLVVPLVWTWCGIVLPTGDGSWLGWRWFLEPVAAPLFLLMTAGCLLCDLKDARRDKEAGVPSVPALVGTVTAARVAVVIALVAAALAVAEGRPGLAVSALLLSGLALYPALLATDEVGPLLVDAVLTLPGVLIVTRLV